jgi:hypothetical protein
VFQVANQFAEHPSAITMGANSEVCSHLLFATLPGIPNRDTSTWRVATSHLRDFVVQAIAGIDAAISRLNKYRFTPRRASIRFFSEAHLDTSLKKFVLCLVLFQLGQRTIMYYMAWPSCAESTSSTVLEQAKPLRLNPVGWEKVIVHGGESGTTKGFKVCERASNPIRLDPGVTVGRHVGRCHLHTHTQRLLQSR